MSTNISKSIAAEGQWVGAAAPAATLPAAPAPTEQAGELPPLRSAIMDVLVSRANGLGEDYLFFKRAAGDDKRPINMIIDEIVAALAARPAPTEAPKESGLIDYRYLNIDTLEFVASQEELVRQVGVGGIIKSFMHYPQGVFVAASKNDFTETAANIASKKAARQAPDSRDAARWREVLRRIGWREIGTGRGCLWSIDLPTPPKHGNTDEHFAAFIDAAIAQEKS